MTDKKDLRKNLNICLLLTLLLCVLAVVPLFAPQADWRLNAAIFAGQVVLVLPLLYYAKAVLRRGRQLLFGGVPAMEGLAFAACAAGLIGSFALGISALQGGAALNGLLLAPLALMLFLIFAAAYFKTQSGLLDAEADEVLTPDGTAAVLLPAVFALALAAALSWWFRGWGVAGVGQRAFGRRCGRIYAWWQLTTLLCVAPCGKMRLYFCRQVCGRKLPTHDYGSI